MDIFFKVLLIYICTFSTCANVFLNFFAGLLKKILNKKILLAAMKTLTNSETCIESHITVLFRLTISVIGRVYPRDLLLLDRRKVGGNIHVMGSLRNNLQNHRRVPEQVFSGRGWFLNVPTSSLKRVTGRTFKISKCFQRSK
jgi:hypothetical protein